MNDLPQVSVMNLRPDDILLFSTMDKISQETYQRINSFIEQWKRESRIDNKHLLLTSLELKILRQENESNI
jgi:hypothetical protein